MADANTNQVTEDLRFVLGEISATVRAMPPRMDRFESDTQRRFTELSTKLDGAMKALEVRVLAVERAQEHAKGVRGALTSVSALIVAFVSSSISGLIVYFVGKH